MGEWRARSYKKIKGFFIQVVVRVPGGRGDLTGNDDCSS